MYDVAIIGGGPAGSTAAAHLARRGRNVVVIERDRHPRFHIGESLLPLSMGALERSGVMPKIQAAGFMPKYGAEISAGCGTREVRFYFRRGFRADRDAALQVERARFDKILLDHAAESGAAVLEETQVTDFEVADDRVILKIRSAGLEENQSISARYLLDASGRNAVVGTKFDLKHEYPTLRKFAVYAHFEGVSTPDGEDGTLTRMVRADDCWFWMIPLGPKRTSVGVVVDTSDFKRARLSPEAFLDVLVARVPVMAERMKNSRRVTQVYASGDYSYRSEKLAGDRWVLAGDAAGFIDPIFSSGVFLAIFSGERAAQALDLTLDDPRAGQAEIGRYCRDLRRVMKLYLGFVEGWYQKPFVETLLNPTEFFDVVPAVNSVLAGNLGNMWAIRWRLWLFKTVVALQRVVPLSPRIKFEPVVG